jgi:hypothetical protein
MKITVEKMVKCLEDDCFYDAIEKLWSGREFLTEKEIIELPILPEYKMLLLYKIVFACDPTKSMMRRIILDILSEQDIPVVYKKWLETGDEDSYITAKNTIKEMGNGVVFNKVFGIVLLTTKDINSNTILNVIEYTLSCINDNAAEESVVKKYTNWMVEYLGSI